MDTFGMFYAGCISIFWDDVYGFLAYISNVARDNEGSESRPLNSAVLCGFIS